MGRACGACLSRSVRNLIPDAREVYEAASWIRQEKLDPNSFANTKALFSTHYPSINRGLDQAGKGSFWRDARDDRIKLIPDPLFKHHCGSDFAHLSLDLARRILAFGAVPGSHSQLALSIRRRQF